MILVPGMPGVAFGTAAEGDLRQDEDRRTVIATDLGIPQAWAWLRQVHGRTVHRATGPGLLGDGDAAFTTVPGLAVAVATADCYPVALTAPGAVGIAHAGWRGAAAGVVTALRQAMAAAGHVPEAAAIGPGIGRCCFEVGPEVAERFPGRTATTSWGTASVDLPAALSAELDGLEVWVADLCTMSDEGFESFRRDGTTARQVAVAWLPG